MICSKCGMQNADNSKFCSSCGTQLIAAETAATVDPTAPPYTAPYAEEGSPAQPIPPMAPPMGAPAQAPPPPQYGAPGQVPPPQYGAPPQAPPYGAPVLKPYKTEYILGLIGSILAIVIFLVMLVVGAEDWYVGGVIIIGSLFVLASFILGFIGISKLNRGDGKGGILLTVGGGLGFLATFFGLYIGWITLFFFPLLLTAGIMALAKRSRVEGRRY